MFAPDDLIAAPASAAGPAARGILRITGRDAFKLLADWIPEFAAAAGTTTTAVRCAVSVRLPHASSLVAVELQWWPGRRSYTGQPLAELHVVGSPPLLSALLSEALGRGARLAEPGEFTLRAFLSGKVDLLQAEAVLGVIDSQSPEEFRTALQQLAGGISGRMAEVQRDLLDLLADLEAGLDFVEEHLEFVERDEITRRLRTAREFVDQLCEQSSGRMHARQRPRVVLAGLPNVGKSTLFNALVGSERALVSAEPGTTRDYLTAVWDCRGHSVDLVDTAGWESRAGDIAEAMRRLAQDQLNRADLILWCSACDLTDEAIDQDEIFRGEAEALGRPILRIETQRDRARVPSSGKLDVSAVRGYGLTELAETVRRQLTENAPQRDWLSSTAARCEQSLRATRDALSQAEAIALDDQGGDELIAGELRTALQHLGETVGTVYTDDLLDRIFSKFCIGK